MKRLVWNAACAISVMGCALVLGCGDDSSSTSPQENVGSSSSFAEWQGSSAGENLGLSAADDLGSSGSQPSDAASSSSVVESSSAAAKPSQLCKISMATETGYPNVAVISAFTTICLPLDNCDTSAVNTGYDHCIDGRATVDGCAASIRAEVVESCDGISDEPTCEIPNGPVYIKGRFNTNCSNVLR